MQFEGYFVKLYSDHTLYKFNVIYLKIIQSLYYMLIVPCCSADARLLEEATYTLCKKLGMLLLPW